MFDALSSKPNREAPDAVDARIGTEVEIQGNTTFSGCLRIDGKIEGDVTARGAGPCTLIVSEHAEVQGNITAPRMVINGRIKGKVVCSERIALQSQARVTGDVCYDVIVVAPGAVIDGRLARDARGQPGKAVVAKFKPATPGKSNS
jgi:cytoskeletal protein CcmA (bactofilin family)